MRFMRGADLRSPRMVVAVSTPLIIAPTTPQQTMSCPVSHTPGIFLRGESHYARKRCGSWSRP